MVFVSCSQVGKSVGHDGRANTRLSLDMVCASCVSMESFYTHSIYIHTNTYTHTYTDTYTHFNIL